MFGAVTYCPPAAIAIALHDTGILYGKYKGIACEIEASN